MSAKSPRIKPAEPTPKVIPVGVSLKHCTLTEWRGTYVAGCPYITPGTIEMARVAGRLHMILVYLGELEEALRDMRYVEYGFKKSRTWRVVCTEYATRTEWVNATAKLTREYKARLKGARRR